MDPPLALTHQASSLELLTHLSWMPLAEIEDLSCNSSSFSKAVSGVRRVGTATRKIWGTVVGRLVIWVAMVVTCGIYTFTL